MRTKTLTASAAMVLGLLFFSQARAGHIVTTSDVRDVRHPVEVGDSSREYNLAHVGSATVTPLEGNRLDV